MRGEDGGGAAGYSVLTASPGTVTVGGYSAELSEGIVTDVTVGGTEVGGGHAVVPHPHERRGRSLEANRHLYRFEKS